MPGSNRRSIESKITRLTREITEVDQFFYGMNEDDRFLYASMLERKRDDMVRAVVLQLHTAIEDILTSQIMCCILNVRPEGRSGKMSSKSAHALHRMLFGAGSIGFDMKLNLAMALRLLSARTQKQLMELNTLRNKCSHNWLLKVRVRRRQRPKQRKPPLLLYQGRDLHNVAVLKDFVAVYSSVYLRLFAKYVG